MALSKKLQRLKGDIQLHYRYAGRHDLPWRVTQTPYTVFVSEIMLQQTQVHRVLPKYTAFIQAFPNFKALGSASLSQVYALWQGLGYNRRAKYLRDAAQIVTEKYKGVLPHDTEVLQELPGIGPYTAGAITSFAYGKSAAFVETNLRTVVMHHMFPSKSSIQDKDILKVLRALEPKEGEEAKRWYAALMDYGAHLKASGVKLNAKSAHYKKQSAFKGSLRQVRGALLREIAKKPQAQTALERSQPYDKDRIETVLGLLSSEGLIVCKREIWRLVS